MVNLSTKFEVSNSTHYEVMKLQNIEIVVVWVIQGHWKYRHSIEKLRPYGTIQMCILLLLLLLSSY